MYTWGKVFTSEAVYGSALRMLGFFSARTCSSNDVKQLTETALSSVRALTTVVF